MTPHDVTRNQVRASFLALIAIIVAGLVYLGYRGDQSDDALKEIARSNCNLIRTNTEAMIKLHEDIAAGFAGQGRPVPPAVQADLDELHRIVPTCEGL